MQAEYETGRNNKKLYTGVKERSDARDKTAETLQRRKETVDYAPKNGKNFTALSRKSRETTENTSKKSNFGL
ncbi:hypothetical protein CJI48_03840 [Bifidobacteriaceae bacterium GH005]|nr:hypothetical protein CJI48_03840 [Bifidobacteriaceae bacterium GH005]